MSRLAMYGAKEVQHVQLKLIIDITDTTGYDMHYRYELHYLVMY